MSMAQEKKTKIIMIFLNSSKTSTKHTSRDAKDFLGEERNKE